MEQKNTATGTPTYASGTSQEFLTTALSHIKNSAQSSAYNPAAASTEFISSDNITGKTEVDGFDAFMTNPPFGSFFDREEASEACHLKTTKTELLFLHSSIRLLRHNGRLSTIIPEGVLFGNSKAHGQLRAEMLDRHGLDALVSIPAGVFKPNAGVSTCLLLLTKGRPAEHVWFAEMTSDGFSLDQKRRPVKDNDIPVILRKWAEGDKDADPTRKGKSFFVPVTEIRANSNNLHPGRYREVEVEKVEHRSPTELVLEMIELEKDISTSLNELLQMTLECDRRRDEVATGAQPDEPRAQA